MNTKLLVAASLLGAAGLAQAQQAGSVIISLGGAQITPHVDSADLTAPSLVGTKIDVRKASQSKPAKASRQSGTLTLRRS